MEEAPARFRRYALPVVVALIVLTRCWLVEVVPNPEGEAKKASTQVTKQAPQHQHQATYPSLDPAKTSQGALDFASMNILKDPTVAKTHSRPARTAADAAPNAPAPPDLTTSASASSSSSTSTVPSPLPSSVLTHDFPTTKFKGSSLWVVGSYLRPNRELTLLVLYDSRDHQSLSQLSLAFPSGKVVGDPDVRQVSDLGP